MPNYDFKTLSSHDFEHCVRDLLQKELNIRLESFKTGRDQGIDLRYSTGQEECLIVQCKHYAESGFHALCGELKKLELPKIQRLKPKRYILVTSVGLTPSNKGELKTLLSPFCMSQSDIYGKEDLNNLLGRHPEIERKNFKLWLSSSVVLTRIVHSKIFNYTETELERIKRKIKLYVQNDSFFRAVKVLEDQHYCIIAGIPGIGKTTLAEILLINYLRRGYEPIKITNDISEAYEVLDQTQKQLFYYDDFLGQTSLEDKLNKNEDESILRFLDTVRRSRSTKLVLTTREYILAQAKATYEKLSASSFDYKKCVIDLADYTKFHRAKILYNHLFFSSLSPEYLEALLSQRNYMKIVEHPNFNPRIIEWMTDYVHTQGVTAADYVHSFVSSLNNPEKLWKHAFEKQLTNSARHVLLVLVSLPDEVLLEDLARAFWSFYEHRSKEHRFPTEPNDFKQALKELESNFIRISKFGETLIVKFHNPSIRDFLVNYLKDNPRYTHELITSGLFYEQIMRLWGSSFEGDASTTTRLGLIQMGKNLGEAVKRLLRSEDCRLIEVRSHYPKMQIEKKRDVVPVETRAIYALGIARRLQLHDLVDFTFIALVNHLSSEVHKPGLGLLLRLISEKGPTPPQQFLESVKQQLLRSLNDFDDFESVVEFAGFFPSFFPAEELDTVRREFERVYGDIVDSICSDVSDSDEITRYAQLLKGLGKVLRVDVEYEYDLLQEQASEIAGSYEEGGDDDYERWSDAGEELVRTDGEIHSMFDSLR